jgi:K+-dependent Na+/Ca+ exchanger-like protein
MISTMLQLPSSTLQCILHVTIASISLWTQSIVTETRLVPSIDIIAKRYGIPDDIAGATLIAAGASAPELLCTFISLFITHSSLGLGTIVGSEVFNLFIIAAGSVYATEGRMLQLERKSMLRDAGFYAFSIGLLYLSLSDGRDVYVIDGVIVDDGTDGAHIERRIFVQFWKACLLLGGYVIYVVVCMNSSMDNKEVNDGAKFHDGGNVDDDNVARECMDTTVSSYALNDTCNNDDNDHNNEHATSHNTDDEVDNHHMDLISKPTNNASKMELFLWYFFYPLRLLMHITLPHYIGRRFENNDEVDTQQRRRGYSSYLCIYITVSSCLVWLCISSYLMVTSLESLAALIGISDAVMGSTVSAAGTSWPAYVASRMAAEKGMGGKAVSNIFGSNTFNICIGLGFPWVLYIIVSMRFHPYTDLDDVGVVESMVALLATLLIFLILVALKDFVLVEGHAILFVSLYVLYVIYTICQDYWHDESTEHNNTERTG